jgi:hypothetical protein
MHYRLNPAPLPPRCVETAFLKSIGQSNKDVLFVILFTILFGFVWPVWSNLKRLQCQLDDVFWKIDALQQSTKVTDAFSRVSNWLLTS